MINVILFLTPHFVFYIILDTNVLKILFIYVFGHTMYEDEFCDPDN